MAYDKLSKGSSDGTDRIAGDSEGLVHPGPAQEFINYLNGDSGNQAADISFGPSRSQVLEYNRRLRAASYLSDEDLRNIFTAFSALVPAAVLEVSGGVLSPDLIQEGYAALTGCLVVQGKDQPSVNDRSHVFMTIERALINAQQTGQHILRDEVSGARRFSAAYAELQNERGRLPTTDEVANRTGMSRDVAANLAAVLGPLLGEPTDEPLPFDDETVSAEGVVAPGYAWTDNDQRNVKEVLGLLDELDSKIAVRYAFLHMTFAEIAEQLGISESRVHYHWRRFPRTLRWRLYAERRAASDD